MVDVRRAAYALVMDRCRIIEDYHRWANRDESALAADLARAEADVAAGRVHSHAIVGEWLKTWGKPGRLPVKEWLARRDG
ncbi:hypothetical protein [Sphingomonas sp. 8AM]|uniref:hypothetical protein n=1 Tax=Sphingomonas sp. 8AM TaxID=2653170 RepID=UPI001F42B7E5|nr:hypothetical protein [Sphingomonas sp. 8AM]